MKQLKKLELVKKTVVELSKKESRQLKGGSSNDSWNTQINTCAWKDCCK